ncbi:DUF6301 family protein [Actinomycetes bacterium KLBMP 9797]
MERLTADEITEVAGALAGLSWSWTVDDLDRLVDGFGWPIAAGPSVGGAVLQTGLAPHHGFADVRFDGGAVGAIVVRVTDGSPEATDPRRDAFAAAVTAVTGVAGPPTERRPGPAPEVRWRVPSGVLRVTDDGVFVELALLSEAHAALIDEADSDQDDGEDDW